MGKPKNLMYCDLVEAYVKLLTEKQQEIMISYYLEDLTLSETARNMGIDRQTVNTVVRRAEKMLEKYEEKLHLVEKFGKINHAVEKTKNPELIDEILQITRE